MAMIVSGKTYSNNDGKLYVDNQGAATYVGLT